jgi:site-specific DNA recombinase
MKAVLYARFSPRPDADTSDSIEKQSERLRAFCLARDWEIAGEYQDADKSGATTKGRIGLEDAIAHACRLRCVLLAYDPSRLSRDVGDSEAIVKRLERRHATLATVVGNLDLTTAHGRLTFRIECSINAFNREIGNERTSKAMKHHQDVSRRRMGRADRVPYGMRAIEGNGLEPDHTEQVIIQRIIALDAAGMNSRTICRQLEAEGFTRRSGKPWPGGHRLVQAVLDRAAKA